MNKPSLKILASAGTLVLSTVVFSVPSVSHQISDESMDMGHQAMRDSGHMEMMGHHVGMMGYMPMMGGGHMAMMGMHHGLGLSDEQQQKIHEIQYELRKKHWGIMGQMIDQQAALHKAYAVDRPDPKAVGSVYSQIFDLKRQMIEASLEAKNSMTDVLTEDQVAQMKKMRHGHRDMMPRHDRMHGQGE